MRLGVLPLLLATALGLACSSEAPSSSPTDAGVDVRRKVDAGKPVDAGPDVADARLDRMTSAGTVLANMKLTIIYIGKDQSEGAPSWDDYVSWLVTSGWWGIMKQYGVGPGQIVGSVRVPTADVIQPTEIDANGRVPFWYVNSVVGRLIETPADGGAPIAPKADAYLVFMPWGVNVDVGDGFTCVTIGGYHSTVMGNVPYALIPPCPLGLSGTTISHELAEMATDPVPFSGWTDRSIKGGLEGEIGDLCNSAASWDGHVVTRLWSNEAGDCIPE